MSATMPSRDFLVQQATLSALHGLYPAYLKEEGAACVANSVANDIASGHQSVFVARVIAEFRALTSRYGVSP